MTDLFEKDERYGTSSYLRNFIIKFDDKDSDDYSLYRYHPEKKWWNCGPKNEQNFLKRADFPLNKFVNEKVP